jgi:hypothetical protein
MLMWSTLEFSKHSNFRVNEINSYAVSRQDQSYTELSFLSLPPKAYIGHLAQVAGFHLNANHYFFVPSGSSEQLDRALLDSLQAISGVWHLKLWLIIALRRLFLEKGATSLGPPGIHEFLPCISSVPSPISLSSDPITGIEALCLMAFYAQAAEVHTTAYLYVSVRVQRSP